ncbi:MAG: 30S ribosomal protein S17 [Candidatus Falkowbacteria bacterium]
MANTKSKIEKVSAAKPKILKKFSGEVVSDKGDKTIVVKVERIKMHPKYKKRYKVTSKYKVHDEKNECSTGDKVSFVECRPLSKEKKWRVVTN